MQDFIEDVNKSAGKKKELDIDARDCYIFEVDTLEPK